MHELLREEFNRVRNSTHGLVRWINHNQALMPAFFDEEPLLVFSFCRSAEVPVIRALIDAKVDFASLEKKRSEPPCLAQATQNPDPAVFDVLLAAGLSPKDPFWPINGQSIADYCIDEDMAAVFSSLIEHDKFMAPLYVRRAILSKSVRCFEVALLKDPNLASLSKVRDWAEEEPRLKSVLDKNALSLATGEVNLAPAPAPPKRRTL